MRASRVSRHREARRRATRRRPRPGAADELEHHVVGAGCSVRFRPARQGVGVVGHHDGIDEGVGHRGQSASRARSAGGAGCSSACSGRTGERPDRVAPALGVGVHRDQLAAPATGRARGCRRSRCARMGRGRWTRRPPSRPAPPSSGRARRAPWEAAPVEAVHRLQVGRHRGERPVNWWPRASTRPRWLTPRPRTKRPGKASSRVEAAATMAAGSRPWITATPWPRRGAWSPRGRAPP